MLNLNKLLRRCKSVEAEGNKVVLTESVEVRLRKRRAMYIGKVTTIGAIFTRTCEVKQHKVTRFIDWLLLCALTFTYWLADKQQKLLTKGW